MQPDANLKELFRVTFILKIIGALPLFTLDSVGRSIRLSRWSGICAHLIVAIHVVIEFCILVLLLGEKKIIQHWFSFSKTVNTTQAIEFPFGVVVSLSISFICWINGKDQVNLLKRLMEVTCSLRKMNVISDEGKCKYNAFFGTTTALLCVLYPFVCAFFTSHWDLLDFILYGIYWIQITFTNANLSYVGSVCFTVFSQLRGINNELECDIQGCRENPKELILLIALYGRLCQLIHNLNKSYGLITFISIVFSSYHLTKNCFFIYVIKRRGYKSEDYVGCFMWICSYSLYIVSLCIRCGRLKTEVS